MQDEIQSELNQKSRQMQLYVEFWQKVNIAAARRDTTASGIPNGAASGLSKAKAVPPGFLPSNNEEASDIPAAGRSSSSSSGLNPAEEDKQTKNNSVVLLLLTMMTFC